MQSNDTIALIAVVLAVLAVTIFKGPFGRALADRLRGAATPNDVVAEELEVVKARLAEVEERLDFAERMLAKGDRAERLPGRGTT